MAKKKKQKEEVFDDYEEDFDTLEEENEENENIEEVLKDVPEFENVPENAMGLAHQINKESETVKAFKDMPRETRFSFLDATEKEEVKHHARSYRTWKYIEKVIYLREQEDKQRRQIITNVKMITNKELLKQYLEDINREYMINVIDDIEEEDINKILAYVQTIKPNYMLETIEKRKERSNKLYEEYKKVDTKPDYIDDLDNLGKVIDTSILSMGYKGNAAQHSIMTINAVKNEDIQKEIKEKTSFSLMDAIKKRFG